jgi:hypothetical protein
LVVPFFDWWYDLQSCIKKHFTSNCKLKDLSYLLISWEYIDLF